MYRFLWFAFGMLLFSYTWFNIISLVQVGKGGRR